MAPFEKIGVWVGGWQIKSLLTGDGVRTFGNPTGPYKEFAFNPGERITGSERDANKGDGES